MPLHLYAPTPAAPTARLGNSIPLHLYVPGPAAHLQSSGAQYLYASMSARLQPASIPPRLHAWSASPELLRQLLHVPTHAARLQSSRSVETNHLHVYTPAAHLQTSDTSVPPQPLHACSAPSELRSSIPLRLHVCTPAARLHTSHPLVATVCLQSSRALEANTSTSLYLQLVSRAPYLSASVCSVPPQLQC